MLNTVGAGGKKIDESEIREEIYQKNKIVPFHYTNREIGLVNMIHLPEKKKRTRLVVKRGIEHISMILDNLVLFYTENKIVYTVDDMGKKYIVERTLSELIYELDDRIFFRANRQYIINLNHIKSFKAYEKVKLKVDLKIDEVNAQHFIIISQETTPAFKKWIYAA
jgi:DNA-binding LytR/AlgR family response regulator